MPLALSSEAIRLARLGTILLWALLLLGVAARWSLVHRLPFIMDELVDTQLGVQVARGVHLYADQPWERTPLMTYFIGVIHDPDLSSFDTAIAIRRAMWLFMIGITLQAAWIGRSLGGKSVALLSAALLLAFSNFLGSSIQVRSDVMATAFSLPALWTLIRVRASVWAYLVAGLSLGMAFVTTQKAIYFVVAFAVALSVRSWCELGNWRTSARRTLFLGSVAALGVAVPLSAMFFVYWRMDALPALLEQAFERGARAGLTANTYSGTWIHVPETLGRNPGIWMLGIAGACGLLAEGLRRRDPEFRAPLSPQLAAAGAWTLALLCLYLQHTSKFPYVFVNLAPGLAICGAVILVRLAEAAFSPRPRIDWRALCWSIGAVGTLVLYPYHHLRTSLRSDLLMTQREIMNRVDLLTAPDDAVFDGIGIATTRRKATPWSMMARWFDERKAGAEYDVLGSLEQRQPKVMIWNYRLSALQRDEQQFVRSRFVHDWANIWVVGASTTAGGDNPEARIELLTSTTYILEAQAPDNVRLDGNPVAGRLNLSAGEHVVSVSGTPQAVTVKLAASADHPPPPARPPSSLFLAYSEW
jgi:hypothetical protein